jgi:hypothetical protein
MNSFVNIIILILALPAFILAIFVGNDLQFEFLKMDARELPYLEEIFLGFAISFGLISLRRSFRRWMGIYIVSQQKRFILNQPINAKRSQRVVIYNLLEASVYGFLGYAFLQNTSMAFAPAYVMYFFSMESILFLFLGIGMRKFRYGISNKAVIVADREVRVLYFKGLRQISISQLSVNFDYIGGLHLNFPLDCVEQEGREEFFNSLRKQVDEDRVLFRNIKSKIHE